MKVLRKIIEIDEELCNGCGQCVISCAEGAIAIIDGKARVISDKYCDGIGACIGECPEKALRIVERETDEFDEEAVTEHLEKLAEKETPEEEKLPCQCPSSWAGAVKHENTTKNRGEKQQSTLDTWPIQIKLIPPNASFLNNSDLLVASDCTGFSCPNLHRDFLGGKTLLIGCPKFDDQAMYRNKFAEIFKHFNIKTVTVLVMEVPCCHGMPQIVKSGIIDAGKQMPIEVITLGINGSEIKREEI